MPLKPLTYTLIHLILAAMPESELDYRDPEWLAESLGLDKTTVYRFLKDGSLPAIQLGRKWLISTERVAEFLAQQEQAQTMRRRVVSWVTEHLFRFTESEDRRQLAVERLADRVIEIAEEPWRQIRGSPLDQLDRKHVWLTSCGGCHREPVVAWCEFNTGADPYATDRTETESDWCDDCLEDIIAAQKDDGVPEPSFDDRGEVIEFQ